MDRPTDPVLRDRLPILVGADRTREDRARDVLIRERGAIDWREEDLDRDRPTELR